MSIKDALWFTMHADASSADVRNEALESLRRAFEEQDDSIYVREDLRHNPEQEKDNVKALVARIAEEYAHSAPPTAVKEIKPPAPAPQPTYNGATKAKESYKDKVKFATFFPILLFGGGLLCTVLASVVGPWPAIFVTGAAFWLWSRVV
jgi:hypothetical protein